MGLFQICWFRLSFPTAVTTVVVWTIMPKSVASLLNPRSATTARVPPTWWHTVPTNRPQPLREDAALSHPARALSKSQALKEPRTHLRTAPPLAKPLALPRSPHRKLPHHNGKRGKNELFYHRTSLSGCLVLSSSSLWEFYWIHPTSDQRAKARLTSLALFNLKRGNKCCFFYSWSTALWTSANGFPVLLRDWYLMHNIHLARMHFTNFIA